MGSAFLFFPKKEKNFFFKFCLFPWSYPSLCRANHFIWQKRGRPPDRWARPQAHKKICHACAETLYKYEKHVFIYTETFFHTKRALISSWYFYIDLKKSLKLMKWLQIASKWRIDCVTVQQSMTNCRSNPFNWHGHLSFSYKRKQLLSTQAQQIMPFLGANLCFGKPFDHFGFSSKLVPVTKLDLSFLELVTVNLKLFIFCI